MTSHKSDNIQIIHSHVLEGLRSLQDNSIHTVVTSFPYWGLRAYGTEPQVWDGDGSCDHEMVAVVETGEVEHVWGPSIPASGVGGQANDFSSSTLMMDGRKEANRQKALKANAEQGKGKVIGHSWDETVQKRGGGGERDYGSSDGGVGRGPAPMLPQSAFCSRCFAWRGELGLEPTLALYLSHVVQVCREIKRVLHPSGSFWLNHGDSYATSTNGRSAAEITELGTDDRTFRDKPISTARELAAKNLVGQPWRIAFALQDDGWVLRRDNVWWKRSSLPESVRDRAGTAHEYIFHFTKSPTYYYDAQAVREPTGRELSEEEYARRLGGGGWTAPGEAKSTHRGTTKPDGGRSHPLGRNLRSVWGHLPETVWDILPEPQNDPGGHRHYAAYPVALPARCITATTSEYGVCSRCLGPWRRRLAAAAGYEKNLGTNEGADADRMGEGYRKHSNAVTGDYETLGWEPSCSCFGKHVATLREIKVLKDRSVQTRRQWRYESDLPLDEHPRIPAIVLDPFSGTGTTGVAARMLGRSYVGIELSEKDVAYSLRRLLGLPATLPLEF